MLAATAFACTEGNATSGGPLVIAGGDSTVSIRTDPQTLVAYGYNMVTNLGPEPVANAAAELVRDEDGDYSGVEVEAVKVVETEARHLDYLGAGQWPFPTLEHAAAPLDGYTFKPDGRRVELLFIVKVTTTGRWLWPKTRIAYEAGGKRYAEEISNGFLICAPANAECDPTRP